MISMIRNILLVTLFCAPSLVQAGALLDVSLGQSIAITPAKFGKAETTSLMLAPGWAFSEAIDLTLGFAGTLDAENEGVLDLDVRTNLTLSPQASPLYGRIVLAVLGVLEGASRPAIGAAFGSELKLPDLTLFGEFSFIPYGGEKNSSGEPILKYPLELRFGARFNF